MIFQLQECFIDESILAENRCIIRSVLTYMSEEDEGEFSSLFTGVEEAEGNTSQELNLKPVDRPRGILTPTDRDYLCGQKEYSHEQTELNRQQSIRERITEAVRDFDLLWLLLDESEREKIIDTFETGEIEVSFSSIISFMYLGVEQDTDHMEEIIEQGIYQAVNYDRFGRWSGGANEVSVNIDIDRHPDVDELYTEFKRRGGEQLTPAEVGTLVQAGKLDAEDLQVLENSTPRFPKISAGGALEQTDET